MFNPLISARRKGEEKGRRAGGVSPLFPWRQQGTYVPRSPSFPLTLSVSFPSCRCPCRYSTGAGRATATLTFAPAPRHYIHGICRGERRTRVSVKHAMLGLLLDGPLHGYGLRSAYGKDLVPGAALNIGQVYQALDKLEADGFVTAEVVPQPANPDRRVYTL